jgi:VIT1/CCC1 family predicted Fe2+/Mn2+ transporter
MSGGWRHSLQVGLSFGLTSGIITALGLIVGLAAGTQSRLAVVGGIVTIALADSLSDALGIHVSEELESVHTSAEVWMATVATFVAKLLASLSFLFPVLILDLGAAVIASICWGAALVSLLSVYLARVREVSPWPVVAEHLGVATVVVGATHLLGRWVSTLMG